MVVSFSALTDKVSQNRASIYEKECVPPASTFHINHLKVSDFNMYVITHSLKCINRNTHVIMNLLLYMALNVVFWSPRSQTLVFGVISGSTTVSELDFVNLKVSPKVQMQKEDTAIKAYKLTTKSLSTCKLGFFLYEINTNIKKISLYLLFFLVSQCSSLKIQNIMKCP